MNTPEFYQASDYAGLRCRNASFYYGYEHSICTECGNKNNREYCDTCENADREWCFTAKIPEQELIVIPFSKLKTNDMFDVIDGLNAGIGWILAKYELKKV